MRVHGIQRMLLVLLGVTWVLTAGEAYDRRQLARVETDDPLVELLSELYRTSGELCPSHEALMTYGDIRSTLRVWDQGHMEKTVLQQSLLLTIQQLLENPANTEKPGRPALSLTLGLDFLYKPVKEEGDSVNAFFTDFRDREFQTRYSQRESFVDVGLATILNKNMFVDIHYAARTDWEQMADRDYHQPLNLKEINFDLNRKAYILFKIQPITLLFGRDQVTLGPGKHGKLLLSDNIPALDQFRFQYNWKNQVTFNNIIAPVKFQSTPDHTPKTLIVHRLEWLPVPSLRLGVYEGMVTNQRLRMTYLNPFLIYHNVSDYSLKRNVLAGIDIDWQWGSSWNAWLSVLFDELDIDLVEELLNGRNRRALGIQAGFTLFSPLGMSNSHLTLEAVHLDDWLYNYPYADGTLTFVYEEERYYQGHHLFNRFIGHYLGSNADAIYVDFTQSHLTFSYQGIQQGPVAIYEPGFTVIPDLPRESKHIVGARLQADLPNQRVSVDMGMFYTMTKNYHNQDDRKEGYPEIWIQVSYRLF